MLRNDTRRQTDYLGIEAQVLGLGVGLGLTLAKALPLLCLALALALFVPCGLVNITVFFNGYL